MGLALTINGYGGIYSIPLTAAGENSLGSAQSANTLRTDTTWKLFQQSIDNAEQPPLFAIAANEKSSIYRVTVVATKIYTNTSLNFWDYPVDVGRYHLIVVMPGKCEEPLASANYAYAHVVYVNFETLSVDFCHPEVPRSISNPDAEACGNGLLDNAEECDDGNKRTGDGCDASCLIEPGWRCFNAPYQTKCNNIF